MKYVTYLQASNRFRSLGLAPHWEKCMHLASFLCPQYLQYTTCPTSSRAFVDSWVKLRKLIISSPDCRSKILAVKKGVPFTIIVGIICRNW
ncbi:hypothetical protein E6H20_01420 [Candidatus Bathyarchaeota archaeon]|nr:MAG: hypothetical protein E6H20_01420 [Candidatus Bathyarchaeota archaeon]